MTETRNYKNALSGLIAQMQKRNLSPEDAMGEVAAFEREGSAASGLRAAVTLLGAFGQEGALTYDEVIQYLEAGGDPQAACEYVLLEGGNYESLMKLAGAGADIVAAADMLSFGVKENEIVETAQEGTKLAGPARTAKLIKDLEQSRLGKVF